MMSKHDDKHKDDHAEKTAPKAAAAGDADPSLYPLGVEPQVRPGASLPVELGLERGKGGSGAPVGPARHAESPEEADKIKKVETAKIPPPGSRNYVAGQPVNEEEYARTQDEAARLAAAGKAQRSKEEQEMHERDPNDPEYKPPADDKSKK